MNAAIIGASGYSGEELVRLLSRHPNVQLAAVTSRSLAGQKVADVMPALRHTVGDLEFTSSDPAELAQRDDLDVFFLALPHGVASEFAYPLYKAGKTVIDLSADFRLNSTSTYENYYGHPHPAPELLKAAPYVIPELADDSWKTATLIACPGCYPTSIQLPLVPLLKAGLIKPSGIVINSYSGVSGAGRKVAEDFIYCERNESMKGYGMPKHRHLSEIEEQLEKAAFADVIVQFNPHLAPMSRGISTTIVAKSNGVPLERLYSVWNKTYEGKPFVSVLPSGTYPDTKYVTGSNRADISAVYDKRTDNFIITSAIDNLLKGASGQAVQILNLKSGFEETAGLI
ncbi:MAG: N-acetyl-gamma-glutamyl-phosphate reductase [Opitutales bacterium]|jgi:N-acetyl-gamma-glutamyl-phosphate reductase|nr:N-acetyl-gamma-glutamyl-phosphate reductase [Opitutales bacterium]MDP4645400.1 N-acetyl-gamma-glutamyl-phosphate reductase [Opitutales bacterium]MDP4693381.1 N-acetyl-gamma-glutamyl-phosphate reductase [Opitutales bacterium]MDP4776386.1 N-acetyl-gamma-glutamyl-phosphate reductase [Opitutales bacterium]MDP4883617.1 N-acetyl-gamma-glutamyl-phosphate reductase [Opitutales bacterium]